MTRLINISIITEYLIYFWNKHLPIIIVQLFYSKKKNCKEGIFVPVPSLTELNICLSVVI